MTIELTTDETKTTIDFLAKELARVTKERDKFKEACGHYISQMHKHAEDCGQRDYQRLKLELEQAKATCEHQQATIQRLEAQCAASEKDRAALAVKLMSIRSMTEAL